MDFKLSDVIKQVGSEKGVDRKTLIETLEAALTSAAKRVFGQSREIEAYYNEELDEVEIFQILQVTEVVENPYRDITMEEAHDNGFDVGVGDELLVQLFYKSDDVLKAKEQDKRYGALLKLESSKLSFGRIAAQTAKQVILQRMREAEQDLVYSQYKDKKGELISGVVRRFEKGNIIVDLDKADAILPIREQTPRESYRPNDIIQAYVKNVQRSSRDPQVILSRADPGLVSKLFEQQVPEIYEGIVKIVRVAREPGLRSKVAVYSRDTDVDPVGACVGVKGQRVQMVVQELRGEKIDIVPYHEEAARFVCSAISPAEVSKVLIDESSLSMELIVPDDQLSLAIGRNGQNVRLAAQLTGWSLDITSEKRLKELMAEAKAELMQFSDISEDVIDTLFTLGYNKLEHIAQAQPLELAQIPGFGIENAERVIEVASEILHKKEVQKQVQTNIQREVSVLQKTLSISEKIAKLLHNAGYTHFDYLKYESDAQRLDRRSSIGLPKAEELIEELKVLVQKHESYDEESYLLYCKAFSDLMDSDLEASPKEVYERLMEMDEDLEDEEGEVSSEDFMEMMEDSDMETL